MNVMKSIWETWEQASKLFEKAVENAPTTLDPKEFLEYQIRMSNFVKEAASLSMDLSNKVLNEVTKEQEQARAEWIKNLSLHDCISLFTSTPEGKDEV